MKLKIFSLIIIAILAISAIGSVNATTYHTDNVVQIIVDSIIHKHIIGDYNVTDCAVRIDESDIRYLTNFKGAPLNAWIVPIVIYPLNETINNGNYINIAAYVTDGNPNYPDGTILTFT
jgi:nucleoside phosphorylase